MSRVTVLPDNFEDWVENSANVNVSVLPSLHSTNHSFCFEGSDTFAKFRGKLLEPHVDLDRSPRAEQRLHVPPQPLDERPRVLPLHLVPRGLRLVLQIVVVVDVNAAKIPGY